MANAKPSTTVDATPDAKLNPVEQAKAAPKAAKAAKGKAKAAPAKPEVRVSGSAFKFKSFTR